MASDRATLLEELGKISLRVTVMEGQSPHILQTEAISHEQSPISTPEQSLHTGPSQTERQSPLEVNARDMTEGTHVEEGTRDESSATSRRGDRHEDELPDDPKSGGNTKKLSATMEKIVKNTFCRSLKPDKRKDIKRKQPIPDTPYTKVPKLDPTIQLRMSVTEKLTDRGLTGMQGYVLDAAVPLVNILESAINGTLTPKDAAESAQQALKLIGNAFGSPVSRATQKSSYLPQ